MKSINQILFTVGLISPIVSYGTIEKENKTKPNIVIIMADDLGYGDLSCYGNKGINTPNLDQMANEGIRFTDFHSNGAVCSPTRAALLTGKYQQRVGISGVVTAKKHRHHGLATSEKTFAESLKDAGYSTGIFGKWHVGYDSKFNPIHQGFDEYIGFVSGNVDYQSHVDQEGYEDWWTGDKLKQEKGYTTDLLTDYAVDFIKRHKDEQFLLYIPHEAPHYPIQGRESVAEREIGGKIGVDFNPGGSEKNRVQLYKEMVEIMDEGIGRVIQTLKDLKLDKNTLVFFCSDNGGTGKLGNNAPLKGSKGSVWEGGHRVSAIAWSPGMIAPKQISHQKLMTMDIYPTIVDFAGGKVPQKIDGISFKKHLLKGKQVQERDLFWQHSSQLAMRRGDWKLVLPKSNSTPLLFDLKTDIGEKNNLASKHPQLVKEMSQEIAEWKEDVTP